MFIYSQNAFVAFWNLVSGTGISNYTFKGCNVFKQLSWLECFSIYFLLLEENVV